MKHILSSCFLLLSITCMAQNFPKKYVDSLTAIALSKKSTQPLVLNRDSVLQLMWQSQSSADRIAMFFDILLNSDVLTPEQSLYYHQLVIEKAHKLGDKVLEASVQAELGYIISRNGNTAKGLKMLYESLEMAEATGNAQAIGIAYNSLGSSYPNNLQMSRDYMSKALAYSRKGNDYLFTCFNLLNLGRMYMQEQKRDSAMTLFLESYRLSVEKNIERLMPLGLLQLSQLDVKANRLHYYRQASLMPIAIRNNEVKFWIATYVSRYYMQEKKMDSAFYFASQVYNNANKTNLTEQLNALALMGEYYRALPNTDSTLTYLERYYTLKDSLYGDKVVEQAQIMAYNDMMRQKELVAENAAFLTRMILYFLSAVAIFLMALAFIFWRSKRKEQQAKRLVQQQKDQLEQTLDKLKATQSQLIQSEKMASIGELTAGIAHEIQNPLNFVNNFSEVSNEMIKEFLGTRHKTKDQSATSEEDEVLNDIAQNLEKINHHGKRAADIVKGMLQHSRVGSGKKEPTDINALCDEYLRLAYHGLRAKDKSFNAKIETDFDESLEKINVIPQDIGRVILNLINNAFYAVNERSSLAKASEDLKYEPTVTVATKKTMDKIAISVKDNGNGIPDKVKDKIFQPFFTTKPTGEGTGLGLSMSYDIVKAHGGELQVETKEGAGSEFIIVLNA